MAVEVLQLPTTSTLHPKDYRDQLNNLEASISMSSRDTFEKVTAFIVKATAVSTSRRTGKKIKLVFICKSQKIFLGDG